ncbi:hypothetical protein [Streptomyces sp. MBT62]|nr:hypothetical protein [Streptomyces sp. MBT62]MBK3567982.1 hypothetical protein [Streptomyces sp. MBT62]
MEREIPFPSRDRSGRRRILRLARRWPWCDVITIAFTRLQALPNLG